MNFFDLEKLRDKLAREKNMISFVKSYSINNTELKNLNTGKKWDDLNDLSKMTFDINPMAFDRTNYVASQIISGSVLDIGSGPGNLVNKLNEKRVHIVGIDISKKSISNLKNRFPKHKFIFGDFMRTNTDKLGTFDYVAVLEVMEHIDPSKIFNFLKKINKLVKNGGFLIVSVPLNEGLQEMVSNGINPNAHVRVYTPSIIKTELLLNGFQCVKEKYLYAFSNNYYLKSFLTKFIFINKKPNNYIVIARKK